MRYVLVEIFGLFWLTPKTPEWPNNDLKDSENFKIFRFLFFKKRVLYTIDEPKPEH